MSTKRPELAQSEEVEQLPKACADEAAAVAFLEAKRWGAYPFCAHCACTDVYQMTDRATGQRNKRFLWRCRDCSKQYTVRTGTVFEESLIPLHKWCRAFWEAASCKNGVSALEMSRKLQVTYKTALFVMHRVRWAMTDDPTEPPKMTGTVESDETYVGGKPRYKGWKHGADKQPRAKYTEKTPVVAVVQRGGEVRTRVVANVTSDNLRQILRENVDESARLITDDSYRYIRGGKDFPGGHETVNHSKGEYVRGDVHTNTVEGFFSRVKRQINGTYHAVSKKHLHRYMDQAAFLYNTRGLNDGQRAIRLIEKAQGKRLMYRFPA